MPEIEVKTTVTISPKDGKYCGGCYRIAGGLFAPVCSAFRTKKKEVVLLRTGANNELLRSPICKRAEKEARK
jgi:hypothetical protein